jgi:sphingomyelin phosphodiesterase
VQLEDADVCSGLIELEGPAIAEDLRGMNLTSDTSDLFCIEFIGLCSFPAVHEWEVPFPTEKPCGAKPPKPSGEKPIQVVHFTDTHVDLGYTVGSNTNCTHPICCQ